MPSEEQRRISEAIQLDSERLVFNTINSTLPGLAALAVALDSDILKAAAAVLAREQASIQARWAGFL